MVEKIELQWVSFTNSQDGYQIGLDIYAKPVDDLTYVIAPYSSKDSDANFQLSIHYGSAQPTLIWTQTQDELKELAQEHFDNSKDLQNCTRYFPSPDSSRGE